MNAGGGGAVLDTLASMLTATYPLTSHATKKKKPRRHRNDEHSNNNDVTMATARVEREDASGGTSVRPSRHRNNVREPDVTRAPSNSTSGSSHRMASTSKRDLAAQAAPETGSSAASLVRQHLASSASSMRPSKQRLERSRLLSHAHIEGRTKLERDGATDITTHRSRGGRSKHNNNNNIDDDNEADSRYSDRPEAAAPERLGNDDEPENARRARKSNRASLASKAPPTASHTDRPPSRQRHAFPTHLVDSNAFVASPSRTGASSNNNSSSNSNSRASRDKRVRSAAARSRPEVVDTTAVAAERPPSRYMVKAKRSAAAHSATSTSPTPSMQHGPESADGPRLPSRRCVDSVFSVNQVNHDPKTDGFADVDESVPPPFRIKVTTDAHRSVADNVDNTKTQTEVQQQCRLRDSASSSRDHSNLHLRRWSPSLGNQESQHEQQCDDKQDDSDEPDDDIEHSRRFSSGTRPLEWFGHDDQINNAHLFETVVSLPSAHTNDRGDGHDQNDFDAPVASDDALLSQSSPSSSSLNATRRDSTRSTTRSRRQHRRDAQPISDQPWTLASNNPFFYSAPSPSTASAFDDMDPETALAHTPLSDTPGDLMTIATEMSDLHLDDFIIGELQPMPLSIAYGAPRTAATTTTATTSRTNSRSTSQQPLQTSLGNDFLSLFAQH